MQWIRDMKIYTALTAVIFKDKWKLKAILKNILVKKI